MSWPTPETTLRAGGERALEAATAGRSVTGGSTRHLPGAPPRFCPVLAARHLGRGDCGGKRPGRGRA